MVGLNCISSLDAQIEFRSGAETESLMIRKASGFDSIVRQEAQGALCSH
jgi:hypothetical protein